jgi:uncharacterized membrane protein YdjX (TVP38/TMEM64 family)
MAKKSPLKLSLFCIWLALIALAIWTFSALEIPLQHYPKLIQDYVNRFGFWGPLLYIFIYTIRPVVFFPATLLTAAAGLLFGPWTGIIYTIIGANLSANVAFIIGRYFGQDVLERYRSGRFHALISGMENDGFITILLTRLLYFPFDFTNYLAGTTRIKWSQYALATLIGILPGSMTFVLFGAAAGAATGVNEGKFGVTLAASIILFISSIVLSRYLKKRNSKLAEFSTVNQEQV